MRHGQSDTGNLTRVITLEMAFGAGLAKLDEN
jgi:hypothetical protein